MAHLEGSPNWTSLQYSQDEALRCIANESSGKPGESVAPIPHRNPVAAMLQLSFRIL
jgi:hypothetical protein